MVVDPLSGAPGDAAPEGKMSVIGRTQQADPSVPRSSARLRALAVLSGSLTDALDPAEAASLVEQKALGVLGATSALVLTVGSFPLPIGGVVAPSRGLHIVHGIGVSPALLHALRSVPPGSRVPYEEVAATGEPIYLRSEVDLRAYPEWGTAVAGAGVRAVGVVPVWANGELRGVLGLTWTEPQVFDEDECAFIITLGVMCAQAIMRAHLRAAELSARAVAEDANRMKSQFLAMISHELRTPMNAVMGYTQLMSDEIDGPVTAAQKDHLQRVRASGRHLLGLIEDLLGYARIEAGGEAVHVEAVALGELVEQALTLVRPLAAAKGIRIRVEGDAAAIELHTDARKLRQILVNLVGNAIKFTDAGDVTLVVRVAQLAELEICFEVTDSGAGMSQADQGHVFEAYWQAGPQTLNALGGTGLGLPLARQLARLLGGDVTISRSEVGAGSSFVVCVPANYVGPLASTPA